MSERPGRPSLGPLELAALELASLGELVTRMARAIGNIERHLEDATRHNVLASALRDHDQEE